MSTDIYRGFKFEVTIIGNDAVKEFFSARASFQKVTGMKSSVEVVEYREGNMADRMEKLAGMMTYDAVTLERGLSKDDAFNQWMKSVCDVTNGSANGSKGAAAYRCDIKIVLKDKKGDPVKEYMLKDAWPSEYTLGDFDATSNDVVIASLVLQHHGIKETNKAG